MTTPINVPTIKAPYLITSRVFPIKGPELESTLNKMYIEIAYAVNARTIGIFDLFQVVTGERWFSANPGIKRQTYRQAYSFGFNPGPIDHNISGLVEFTRIYGTCITDQPDFRPLPYVSTIDTAHQISLTITATQIVIVRGGATPNILSGIVVLEYLLN